MRAHRYGAVVMLTLLLVMLGSIQDTAAQTAPAGEVIVAWHVTIAPTWFDPSTAPPQITPFGILFALHDALVRPLPGKGKMSPSLAESWTESADGLVYEFKLRRDLKFHNGDPITTEDVKFSFERYRGAGAKELQGHVRQVEIVDPLTVRFHLNEPWPDFMTFYGTTATAAGIVVPKKYVTQVGDEGFRKQPIAIRLVQQHLEKKIRIARIDEIEMTVTASRNALARSTSSSPPTDSSARPPSNSRRSRHPLATPSLHGRWSRIQSGTRATRHVFPLLISDLHQ